MPSLDENIELEAGLSPSSSRRRDPGADIELEAGSSPSSSRRRDPGGEDTASRHVPSSVHSGDPESLEAVIFANPSVGDDETNESDDEFRRGYEEGLLLILRRFARLVVSKRRREEFMRGRDMGMMQLSRVVEEEENLVWARTTLSAIKNRDELLPELPIDVSHLLLQRFVVRVNQRRHESLCSSSRKFSAPDFSNLLMPAPGLLQLADAPAWGSSMTRHLFELFHYLSRTEDQQQKRQSLKTIADDVTSDFPLPASLRVTVCDFGDGRYGRFDTTFNAVSAGESLETL